MPKTHPSILPEPARLSDLPPEQRPRERLMLEGAARLDPEQLVALILSTGRGSGEDALQLARSTLSALGGVRRLAEASVQHLCEVKGLGPVKASRLVAAFELARRAENGSHPRAAPHLSPAEPLTPLERVARSARAAWVDETPTIIACQGERVDEAITLALDQELEQVLSDPALIGRWFRRLLLEREGPWSVIACRRGELREAERSAAERLAEGASLLGIHLARVLVVSELRHHELRSACTQNTQEEPR